MVEITQIKGDSEAHPFLSPNDEFAGYGTVGWDKSNLDMTADTTPAMQGGNYVREALKRGLTIEAATGVNPYRFGLIGSTVFEVGVQTPLRGLAVLGERYAAGELHPDARDEDVHGALERLLLDEVGPTVGGRIRAGNNPEGGATFRFTLPLAASLAADLSP